MSREDIVAVLSRLFAVYLAFFVIRSIPAAVALRDGATPITVAILFGVTILILGAAALFWVFPLTVARKLLPVMKEARSEPLMSPAIAWSLAISAVGLWMFATALTDASYWAVILISSNQVGYDAVEFTPDQVAGMVATIVQLIFGLTLILGSNGLRSLIYRIRYGRAGDGF